MIRQPIRRTHPNRPVRAFRSSVTPANLKPLLETPSFSQDVSTEYPVPAWFKKEPCEVSVIVPLRKVGLDQLASSNWSSSRTVEYVFVDDNCPDNSKEKLVHLFQNQSLGKIIYNNQHLGWGESCNIGARFANGKYLIFAHPQLCCQSLWIDTLIAGLEKYQIVGGTTIYQTGMWSNSISAGLEWSWEDMAFNEIGMQVYRGQKLPRPFDKNDCPNDLFELRPVEACSSKLLATTAEYFSELGGFETYNDPFSEGADLCLTARENGGQIGCAFCSVYRNYFHKPQISTSFRVKWVSSNRLDSLVQDKRKAKSPVTSILIQKNGDAMTAATLVPALKKKYPGCKVFFATDCEEVSPHVDGIIHDLSDTERLFQLYYNLDAEHDLVRLARKVGVSIEDCLVLQNEPYIQQEGVYAKEEKR